MQRTLVKCDNSSCTQYGKVKSLTPLYLGNGVQQRIQPVCISCDGEQDMVLVQETGSEENK